MSTHPLPDLLALWAKGELTVEQLTGHLLQHLLALLQRCNDLEKRLRQLEQPAKPQS